MRSFTLILIGMAAGVTIAFENGLMDLYKMSKDDAKDYINQMKVKKF
jgi:hypothetical protein